MNEWIRRLLRRWALIAALPLANTSLILSTVFQAELVYSILKAAAIFAAMYFSCRIVMATWDNAARRGKPDLIKTTMEALDDLEEKGIKVTYNPLREANDEDESNPTFEVMPGQINTDLLSQRERI
jgi:hypothetical protein